jgi:hypothetical protein
MSIKESFSGDNKKNLKSYIFLGYIIVSVIVVSWCYFSNTDILRGQLISIMPWFLEVNFLLIVIAVALNIKFFKKIIATIPKRTIYMVVGLVLGGLILSIFVAPRVHRIFYDENIYLNIGQTIAFQEKAAMCAEGANNYGQYQCAQFEHNKQPNAFPYLIATVFRIFGASELAGFILNNFIFGLSIFVVFLVGYLFFDKLSVGLYAALLFCLIPENVIWANTTAAEPGAALFTGLTVLAALMHLKEKGWEPLFLLFVLLSFSLQFRIESLLVIPLIAALYYLINKQELKSDNFYMFALIAFILLVPHIVQMYAVKNEPWGSSGVKMDVSYFLNNFKTNTLFYLTNNKFPLLFTVFFGVGLFFGKMFLKERLLLFFWFFLFWGIFLFFHAGSYEYGQDVRFSVVSYMPLSILAGLGVYQLENIFRENERIMAMRAVMISLIIVSFLQLMPHIRVVGEEAWGARYDHYYAQKMLNRLPERSIVLTQNPNMFLLWGGNAAQTAIAVNDKQKMDYFFEHYTGGVYFHFNYWCNVDDPREKEFCQNVLNQYQHEKIIDFRERDYSYALYHLSK